jgi:mono/diheme cytochrome c family protein
VISSRLAGIHVEHGENKLNRKWLAFFLLSALGAIPVASAQIRDNYARGELLYSTHCITCHSSQIHWRDKKVAKDWRTLKAEVGRWQNASGLGWSEEEVTDVARYLNTVHYHFQVPALSRSSAGNTTKLTHQP